MELEEALNSTECELQEREEITGCAYHVHIVLEAARKYAEIQKLAPEIAALVDVGDGHPELTDIKAVSEFLIKNGSELYFTRPTLKKLLGLLTQEET